MESSESCKQTVRCTRRREPPSLIFLFVNASQYCKDLHFTNCLLVSSTQAILSSNYSFDLYGPSYLVTTYPRYDREEAESNSCLAVVYVMSREVLSAVCFPPHVSQVTEAHKPKKSPKRREEQVGHYDVLPCVCIDYRIKL